MWSAQAGQGSDGWCKNNERRAESAKAAFNVEWQTTNHGDGRSILSFQKAVSGWWMEVHGGGKTSTSTTPATIPTTIEEPPGCSKVGSHSEVGSFDCERSKGDLSPPEDRLFVPQWKTAQVKSQHRCRFCPYSSRYRASITVHERIHTGEKPFRCRSCQKAFVKRGDLVRHERSHTGEQPYLCEVCGRRFTKKWNLDVHRKRYNH
ncbi:zinc finger protein 502-like isoform X2 [Ixodes scapularis]|uniref:zinc finger protein 502-like isoform X2 n=1 Tax=Ixodes scapularis TaxID=6945 RepID=UPI001C3853FA|nr:zinc finger protein 502-like isoform X2 [Ixodes scapularis]